MRAVATVYELLLGLALCLAPWSRLWHENWFFWRCEGLVPWLQTGVARGAVSGFGVAFFLIALADLLKLDLVENRR